MTHHTVQDTEPEQWLWYPYMIMVRRTSRDDSVYLVSASLDHRGGKFKS